VNSTIDGAMMIDDISGAYLEKCSLSLSQTETCSIGHEMQLSKEFLRIVRSVQHQGWQFLLSLDESWFYFSPRHAMSGCGKAKRVQKEKST
jgi:hypothetical protein